jgi:predicted nucleic acid-binding protein
MILLDTTLVFAQLRANDLRLLNLFQSHGAAICGITRAEVLHGVRNPADQARFLAMLNGLPRVAIPEPLWDEVGLNLASLRAAGLNLPLSDVVIASVAIHHNVELWARDQHFPMIQSVLPALRLFPEPP